MPFFRKIKWRRGMEITPATFEAVDRFNESLASISRRMSVMGCHGLLHDSPINFPITVIDGNISVQVYSLEAVSRSGILFQISGESISLKQPHASGRECYVVVHTDGEIEQEVNDVPYAKPRFLYDYSRLDDIGPDSIPIAKLILLNDTWNVQELYIPPCMTVGSHPELLKIVNNSKALLDSILSKYVDKIDSARLLQIRMLSVELDTYNGYETPKELYVLLRKIVVAIDTSINSGISMPEIPAFNNDDILLSISIITDYLETIDTSAIIHEVKPEQKRQVPKYEGAVYDAETR